MPRFQWHRADCSILRFAAFAASCIIPAEDSQPPYAEAVLLHLAEQALDVHLHTASMISAIRPFAGVWRDNAVSSVGGVFCPQEGRHRSINAPIAPAKNQRQRHYHIFTCFIPVIIYSHFPHHSILSPNAPRMDAYWDDSLILEDINYQEVSRYLAVTPGEHNLNRPCARRKNGNAVISGENFHIFRKILVGKVRRHPSPIHINIHVIFPWAAYSARRKGGTGALMLRLHLQKISVFSYVYPLYVLSYRKGRRFDGKSSHKSMPG